MRRWILLAGLFAATYTGAAPDTASAFGGQRRCGGCSDTCFTPAAPTCTTGCAPAPICLDTGPVQEMHVVLVPTYVTEKQSYCDKEYREEQRQRVVPGFKTVNVPEERVRVVTVPLNKVETKTIEYTVQVPVKSEEQKTYTLRIPVWTEEPEEFNVMVPVLKEIEEEYCVKVPVLQEVPFSYTVNVPHPITNTVNRTVSSVVPVVKTRTMQFCVPVTKTKTVRVDRGHWENRVEHVPCSSGPGPCVGCADAVQNAPPATGSHCVCRQVWVPNVIEEQCSEIVPEHQTAEVQYLVYEQHYNTVPHECTCIEYRPEVRNGTKKEVVYKTETRTRPRTIVEYVSETRTRTKKVLTFKEEERTETYPVVTYKPEVRTKDVSYTVCVPEQRTEKYTVTRCDQVPENRIETYTERICVPVVKEREVKVCRMVPQVVSMKVCPCPVTPGQPVGPQRAAPSCCGK
jgi:hypothetical protein